jgi:hypothetical protein
MRHAPTKILQATHALLGVLLSVCMLVQPILVQVHLALVDHGFGRASTQAAAALEISGSYAEFHVHEDGGLHAHGPSDVGTGAADADESGPQPHPPEDHADEVRILAPRLQVDTGAVALGGAPEKFVLIVGEIKVRRFTTIASTKRPPPRDPPPSRAPPSVA